MVRQNGVVEWILKNGIKNTLKKNAGNFPVGENDTTPAGVNRNAFGTIKPDKQIATGTH